MRTTFVFRRIVIYSPWTWKQSKDSLKLSFTPKRSEFTGVQKLFLLWREIGDKIDHYISYRVFFLCEATKVSCKKIHRINKRKGPGYPGYEFWNNSWTNSKQMISFIIAKFTQIPGVLIATGKPAKWRPELVGKNGNINNGSRNRVVSRLSARFPIMKWHSRPLTKRRYVFIGGVGVGRGILEIFCEKSRGPPTSQNG